MRALPCAALLGLLVTATSSLLAAGPNESVGAGAETAAVPRAAVAVAAATTSARSQAPALSPYDRALLSAHQALAAGLSTSNLEAAVAAYREVIRLDPARPDGYLHLGGALFQQQELAGAKEAWAAAEARARVRKEWLRQRGQALFGLAMVEEQLAPGNASSKAAWESYLRFAHDTPALASFPQSGKSRIQALDEHQKLSSDYQRVRELVAKRQKELGNSAGPAASVSSTSPSAKPEPKGADGSKR